MSDPTETSAGTTAIRPFTNPVTPEAEIEALRARTCATLLSASLEGLLLLPSCSQTPESVGVAAGSRLPKPSRSGARRAAFEAASSRSQAVSRLRDLGLLEA